jgi:hypothetical protein
MREIRPSGSAGGAGQLNAPFLPRSNAGGSAAVVFVETGAGVGTS